MIRYKVVFIAVAIAMAFSAFAADPTISVEARQRYPWNGLVDLKFIITGTSGMKYDTSFTAADVDGGTNITMATVRKLNGVAANVAKEQLTPGTYNWVWDAAADLPKDWKCDRVTVTGIADVSPFPYSVKFNANGGTGTMANESFTYGTAKALTANAFTRTGYTFQGWATSASGAKAYSDKQSVSNLATSSGEVVNLYAVWKAALYMVVDLSSGSNSSSYPISYLDAVPNGGWSDTYKTTKLVLRRIEPGAFKMQGEYNVTLTKAFYIGVFEVTQKQYALVTGSNPSYFSGDSLPVEKISYNIVRGTSNGAQWPSSSAVDSNTFLGKLRSRALNAFDLPTEAQWEYAYRAGTTTAYYWANNQYGAEDYVWYASNSGYKTHIVGTKKPNPWGLYDMSGNVLEWCLDWYYEKLSDGQTNPVGPSSGSDRVERGGGCVNGLAGAIVRNGLSPSHVNGHIGFRVCLTL